MNYIMKYNVIKNLMDKLAYKQGNIILHFILRKSNRIKLN